MTEPWSIMFNIPPDSYLSANHRPNWHAKARANKTLRDLGYWTTAASRPPRMHRAHLAVTVWWPDRRRRDDHNIMPTLKPLIDGIVDAGLLPDDDRTHLTGPDIRSADELCPKAWAAQLRFVFKELDHAV